MAGMGVHSKMNKGIHQNTQVVGCELHIQRHPARLCKPGGRWQDLGLGPVVGHQLEGSSRDDVSWGTS